MVSTSSSSSPDGIPWVERYRPQTLDDVSHQTEVVSTLKNAVRTGRLPHLLLYGPPGSGKTSVALALCKELWHPTQWRRRVLELNASDERGIAVVREKIKQFASLSVGKAGSHATTQTGVSKRDYFGASSETTTKDNSDGMNTSESDEKKYPNPPFKVIILDEADTVTKDAQAALRRIIEAHSRITRFILICNYVTRIIEPLASRCAKFRFQALPPATMKERITKIAKAEGSKDDKSENAVVITERQIDAVLAVSGGDMRRAVTSLQSVQALLAGQQGSAGGNNAGNDSSTVIDEDTIYELAGLPPDTAIESLYQSLLSHSFDTMQTAVKTVISNGYSVQMLLPKLLEKFIETDHLDELGRAKLAIRIAEAEDKMNDGADEYLQLMTVCGLAVRCLQNTRKARQ
mmetsp:Transcript_22426/g.52933  ORF Transcript_22426/g.52933 Transcript_22426/m.52933 type:complete len:404 (-) Transcript_22426:1319-2530(-)